MGFDTLVKYYASRAQEYERIYDKPERQQDLQALRGIVAEMFGDRFVLEVACGTGYWTEVLAGSADAVVATDINEEMLNIARSKQLPPLVLFRKEDAFALPCLSPQPNAALAAFWWSHVARLEMADFLTRLHSVLAPGASVMFIDNCYVQGSSTPISRTDNDGDTYQIRKLDDGTVFEVRKNFPDEQQLRSALPPGVVNVEVRMLRYYWVLTYQAGRRWE